MEATKANESIKGAAFIVNETAAQNVFTPEDFRHGHTHGEKGTENAFLS